MRPSGIWRFSASSISGGLVRSCIGVASTPGETQLTRMRSAATSLASAREKVAMNALPPA